MGVFKLENCKNVSICFFVLFCFLEENYGKRVMNIHLPIELEPLRKAPQVTLHHFSPYLSFHPHINYIIILNGTFKYIHTLSNTWPQMQNHCFLFVLLVQSLVSTTKLNRIQLLKVTTSYITKEPEWTTVLGYFFGSCSYSLSVFLSKESALVRKVLPYEDKFYFLPKNFRYTWGKKA